MLEFLRRLFAPRPRRRSMHECIICRRPMTVCAVCYTNATREDR